MPRPISPLRYPGGKSALAGFLAAVIRANGISDGTYIEPYCGGAGAALALLLGEHVRRVVLNDIDPRIYAFWSAAVRRPGTLTKLLAEVPLTIDEWRRQRDIYRGRLRASRAEVAFATLYLNRCNRSGIIVDGGPIGGIEQKGKWKLDARFNRDDLIRRVDRVSWYRDRISVHSMDAIRLLREVVQPRQDLQTTLVYLDPPYYHKGQDLYANFYTPRDHAALAAFLRSQATFKWGLSYDDVPEIRELYSGMEQFTFNIPYCAHTRKSGRELLVCSDGLILPQSSTFARGLVSVAV